MTDRTRDTRIVRAISDALADDVPCHPDDRHTLAQEVYDTVVAVGIHDACADEWDDLYAENQRLQKALAYIHDWAALGGEHGEQPDARIMLQADRTLRDPGYDPSEMHNGMGATNV